MSSDPVVPEAEVSFLANEAPLRWMRRVRFVPRGELAVGRRALLAALVSWLPIAGWAVATGRFPAPDGAESILRHLGVHVRCLLAIPLLIAGEAMLHRILGRMGAVLDAAGLVPDERRAAFEAANASVRRLGSATLPWVAILGAVVAITALRSLDLTDDSLAWALSPDGTLGFGGWWFSHVARPLYFGLSLAWLWRLGLVTLWFWKLSRARLALVPTHPDRMGGMAIVQLMPMAFIPLTLAASSVLASAWAHQILSHGAHVRDFAIEAATFTVVWTVVLLLPLLVLVPLLSRTRRAAIPAYGALVGLQGRLTHQKWIEGRDVGDEPILGASEIGPIADSQTMYQAVVDMQMFPIGRKTLLGVLAPIAVPFALVLTLEIPLTELVQQAFKILL